MVCVEDLSSSAWDQTVRLRTTSSKLRVVSSSNATTAPKCCDHESLPTIATVPWSSMHLMEGTMDRIEAI